jgi:hypothetical protein
VYSRRCDKPKKEEGKVVTGHSWYFGRFGCCVTAHLCRFQIIGGGAGQSAEVWTTGESTIHPSIHPSSIPKKEKIKHSQRTKNIG